MIAPLILAGVVMWEVPAPQAIVWTAPRECPDADALRQAIVGRLGRPIAEGELELVGEVSRHAAAPRYRLALRLRVGDSGQQRTLTAGRCASLVDASALLVSLAVKQAAPVEVEAELAGSEASVEVAGVGEIEGGDAVVDSAVMEASQGPDGGAPIVAEADELRLEGPVPALVPAPRSRGPGGVVRLLGGLEFGAVPGVTGAVGVAAGLLWRRVRVEAQGIYIAPRTAARSFSTARVSVLAGSLHGCYRAGRGVVELPLCGGLELGRQRARVQGPGASAATALWAAGVVTAGVAWHVHARVSVALALQGAVHLTRPDYQLSGPGETVSLFAPQPVSGRLLLGLELRLGDRW